MDAKNSKTTAKTTAQVVCALITGLLLLNMSCKSFYRSAYPNTYFTDVAEYAIENDLPIDLVFAVIRTESGFRPEVESSVGARGLMQLTEDTFEWTKSKMSDAGDETYEDMFVPEINIKYGTHLLRLLIDEFESTDTALCAYHAGWGNAKKWLQSPEHSSDGVNIHSIPFGDTKKYVAKINETRDAYREIYDYE